MKRIFCLLLLQVMMATGLFAQMNWIDTMFVTPANPSPSDFIKVHVHYYVPGYDGPWSTKLDTTNISATANWCGGGGAMMHHHIDTFHLPPLLSGTHYFKIDYQWGFHPRCDSVWNSFQDSLLINITGGPVTGIANSAPSQFTAFYRQGQLFIYPQVKGDAFDLKVVSLTGSVVVSKRDYPDNVPLPIELSLGLYVVHIRQGHSQIVKRILVE